MFHVGQRVVCVDGNRGARRSSWGSYPVYPVKGVVYTIRGFGPRSLSGAPGIYLEEIRLPQLELDIGFMEPVYASRRFRPVRDTNISVFTAMLTKQLTPEKV